MRTGMPSHPCGRYRSRLVRFLIWSIEHDAGNSLDEVALQYPCSRNGNTDRMHGGYTRSLHIVPLAKYWILKGREMLSSLACFEIFFCLTGCSGEEICWAGKVMVKASPSEHLHTLRAQKYHTHNLTVLSHHRRTQSRWSLST